MTSIRRMSIVDTSLTTLTLLLLKPMSASTFEVKLSYGCGGNYTITVQANNQSHARKVAEHQTGDKAIGCQRA